MTFLTIIRVTPRAARGQVIGLGVATWPGDQRRTAEDIRRDRERFGIVIPTSASAAISEVAERQVSRLELDEQKRFEELARELELRRIEWRAEYLEELNARRERMITAEIAARLRLLQRQQEEEALTMIVAMTA